MKELNRREFVKTAGAAAGGLILAPSMLAARAHIQGDDAIRIGLVGCGGRGTGAAVQALLSGQNVRIVAMADAFRDQLDDSYQKIMAELENNELPADRLAVPEDHKFAGFDGYAKVIPLCDVVILATPPGFRPMHFEAAVKAGKHVFMEKPVAVDSPGVRQVLKAAEEAKKKKLNVVVGLQRHYETVYQRWMEMLHAGAIGDIVTAHVYWNSGGVWVRPRQEGQTEMEYQMRNWYYFNWLCGDHINEQHIHNLDVGNWAKQAYPVKAHGMGGRLVRTGKGEYEDLGMRGEGGWDNEVHENIVVAGQTGRLKNWLTHDSHESLSYWIRKQNEFSDWNAVRRLRQLEEGSPPVSYLFSCDPLQRRKYLKSVFLRLPFKPVLMFLYLYGFKMGFLDGRAGLYFCALRAAHELNIAAKIFEIRRC